MQFIFNSSKNSHDDGYQIVPNTNASALHFLRTVRGYMLYTKRALLTTKYQQSLDTVNRLLQLEAYHSDPYLEDTSRHIT